MNIPFEPDRHEMTHEDIVRMKLRVLRIAHRELDEKIAALVSERLASSLALQRIKKQKLALKDQIARLVDELTPDIIA